MCTDMHTLSHGSRCISKVTHTHKYVYISICKVPSENDGIKKDMYEVFGWDLK